jgi:peroxiredoxin Q/BCP
MATLKVGDKAPEFKLQADDGSEVTLVEFRGKRVVLYFYPKALTPG